MGFGLCLSLLGLLSWLRPQTLAPVICYAGRGDGALGMLVSEIAMLIIYFGIFLPIGLVFRLLKRDALQLKIDRSAASYWQEKSEPESVSRHYRQY